MYNRVKIKGRKEAFYENRIRNTEEWGKGQLI